MGRGGQESYSNGSACQSRFSWNEVKQHTSRTDRWLVIDGQVYDITQWSKRHPGGSTVIGHYAGQDATEAFRAFHNDLNHVKKFLQPLHLGPLDDQLATGQNNDGIKADFDALTQTVEKMNLFQPSVLFYVLTLAYILWFEIVAYMLMLYLGTGWIPYLLSILCNTVVQAQAGWLQHDFGHLSVFRTRKLNHILHYFVMNWIKGSSKDWWNHLHYQHHAKPNVMDKDPDVRLDAVFVVGEEIPKKVAKERKTSMPFNWQHQYFFAIGPPLLFPIYFQIMMFRHGIIRKQWLEPVLMTTFYIRFAILYIPLLGFWGALFYYIFMRILESHWFVWVTQSNHIPMEINRDKERPWLSLQLYATCNIERSAFNDWFTGHLNHQIEHHLFPRMPRHNLYKITPQVVSLCKKHSVPYTVKTLSGAFLDIVKTLKSSGEIWQHYYEAYHHH